MGTTTSNNSSVTNTNVSNRSTTGDNNLYIIVTIFNPCNFNTRINLYYEFIERLQKHSNIKIYTTECVFGNQSFTVTDSGNPSHSQIRTNDIWWVKENLINFTVTKLPKSSKYIAWLDADIEFTNDNWVNETIKKLSSGYKVLQLFNKAMFLGPNGEIGKIEKSFGSHVAKDNFENSYPHPGLGWGMCKDAFIEMGGLFDLNPVGSGDLHFAHALIGNIKNTIKNTMSVGYKNSVEEWANQVTNVVGKTKYEYTKTIGYVDVDIKHHFHGNEKNRQYVERWDILEKYKFDPNAFFVSSKMKPGYLTNYLRTLRGSVPQSFRNEIIKYFSDRKEDDKTFESFKAISVSNGKNVYNGNNNNDRNKKPDTSLTYVVPDYQQIYDDDYPHHKHKHHHNHDCDDSSHKHHHHNHDNSSYYHNNNHNNNHHTSDGYLSHHPSYT